ncbi:MAG: transposase [bacterium]
MNNDMLNLYSDYLLSSFGQTTATGLSALVEGAVSHDQVTRFLSNEGFDSRQLWRLVKPTVRRIQSPQALVIFDDTIAEKKWTDSNDIIAWHFDHTQGKAIKGLNILSCIYHAGDLDIPVAFDIVRKPVVSCDIATRKESRKSLLTKNEMMRAMLKVCRHNDVPFAYVLADSWYASKDNMGFIKADMEKDFVMAVKSNRKVALSVSDKVNGQLIRIDSLGLDQGVVKKVWFEGLSFPVVVARQVFTNKDGSHGELYLVSSDIELDWDGLTALYQKRWKVEEYHKRLKSAAALTKSPTRVERTQTAHVFMSIYSSFRLEWLKVKHAMNPFALRGKIYLAAIKASFTELQNLCA